MLAIDSGIGGLGVVGALRRLIPGVVVTYLADHGFYPYGQRTDDELTARLVSLVGRAIDARSPELVVVACNTASTIALEALRATFRVPFVGTVPPVKWAASISRTRTIGLLATEATVGRAYVRDLQQRFAPDCRLVAYGARGLADLAEARFVGRAEGGAVVGGAVETALRGLFGQEGGDAIDTVCLGCTHYGMLMAELRAARPDVAWLDPAEAVARRTTSLLAGMPLAEGPETDVALTTRTPDDPAALERAFARYGLGRVEVWTDAPVRGVMRYQDRAAGECRRAH